ncbi:MAG: hypothetical protein JWP35_4083 [Caulobacter sp.]|nr:hypothetical protein [Caulobacter sp.]
MSVAAKSDVILSLAASRDPEDRARLLTSIVEMCDGAGEAEIHKVRDLLGSVFLGLVAQAEHDIRRRLAEKIADTAWAPAPLVLALAQDDIEVARPIIAASPVLQDHDLIRLLVEATLDHQIEVARRPQLGAPVVEAILQQSEPAVMTALAGNDTAAISPEGMNRLVDASRKVVAMRSPLVRHPRLSAEMAQRLYIWVGQSLRTAVAARFRLDAQALDNALADAVREAHSGMDPAAGVTDNDTKLIEKLHAAGQLRSGFLLKVLREGNLSLFVAALARLGNFETDQIQRALDSDRPEILALACAAVGIDRSVYPSILDGVRALNHNRPGGGSEGMRRASGAFGPFDRDIAAMAFRQTASSV